MTPGLSSECHHQPCTETAAPAPALRNPPSCYHLPFSFLMAFLSQKPSGQMPKIRFSLRVGSPPIWQAGQERELRQDGARRHPARPPQPPGLLCPDTLQAPAHRRAFLAAAPRHGQPAGNCRIIRIFLKSGWQRTLSHVPEMRRC